MTRPKPQPLYFQGKENELNAPLRLSLFRPLCLGRFPSQDDHEGGLLQHLHAHHPRP